MSTSKPSGADPVWDPARGAFVPDEGALTQLAREFFGALGPGYQPESLAGPAMTAGPGVAAGPAMAAGPPALPGLPAMPGGQSGAQLGESELRALPSSLSGAVGLGPGYLGPLTHLPADAGALSLPGAVLAPASPPGMATPPAAWPSAPTTGANAPGSTAALTEQASAPFAGMPAYVAPMTQMPGAEPYFLADSLIGWAQREPALAPYGSAAALPAVPLAAPEVLAASELARVESLSNPVGYAPLSYSYAYDAMVAPGLIARYPADPYAYANPLAPATPARYDVPAVRRDFPILDEPVRGKRLVWLDSAATTQKPRVVIERLVHFYEHENSNVHRGAHDLAARATDAYEAARESVRRFIGAASPNEIVFVRGATEGINLVAQSWGRQHLRRGDEILITWLEHHANIVPWQMLCADLGCVLKVAPVDDTGQVIPAEFQRLLGPRVKLVAFPQVSNALGTVTPARELIAAAQQVGARVLVDGAQSVSHMPVDVAALGCDWFVFSGHKVYAPTGIGVVYGKQELLDQTRPYQGGGNMIVDVTFERTVYQPAPLRYEAGTGSIGDAVALGAALDYLERLGRANVARHEHELLVYATRELQRIPGLRIIGTAPEKAGVISFVIDGYRTEDIGRALAEDGIAVRSGHHCAQPILRRFGLESTVRPSFGVYNGFDDVDALTESLLRLRSAAPRLGL